jgi:hypothetical protein
MACAALSYAARAALSCISLSYITLQCEACVTLSCAARAAPSYVN